MQFKSVEEGIEFYMLVKQFKRVADKIVVEGCHDFMLSKESEKAKKTLKYYQTEKGIILEKMKVLFSKY